MEVRGQIDEALSNLNIEDATKIISVSLNILEKILQHPKNKKYHLLNAKRLPQTFQNHQVLITLLLKSGFKFIQSHNGKRLLFDITQINKLQNIKKELLNYRNKFTSHQTQHNIPPIFIETACVALSIIMCSTDITKCIALKHLCKIMNECNHRTANNDNDSYCKYADNIVVIWNYFHHLISFHSHNEKHFVYIYKAFGGECEASQCINVRRHYTKRNTKATEPNIDIKTMHIKQILDTIHCYFCHQYDIGHRLTSADKRDIDDIKCAQDTNHKFRKLNTLLQRKRTKLIQSLGASICSRYSNPARFSSNLYQIEINDNKTSLSRYSHSFPFKYMQKYSDMEEISGYLTYPMPELYVPPKHPSLKVEIIKNEICSLSARQWDQTVKKAEILIKTQYVRQLTANVDNGKKDIAQYSIHHPIHYGYADKEPISINHLISLIIYCEFDELQCEFTATYREESKHPFEYKSKTWCYAANDIMFHGIKSNHANYHHLGKFLKHSVQVFGIKYKDGMHTKMYHGVNRKMLFESKNIYGPLSTTHAWNVAVAFSANVGQVLELVPSACLKYFECEWLSPYPQEGEILFIGGFNPIHFLNIINMNDKYNKHWITLVRYIDTMMNGIYFMVDPSYMHKVFEYDCINVSVLNLPTITDQDATKCLSLIYSELQHNGFTIDASSNDTNTINIPAYIRQLFHHICSRKQHLCICWDAMHHTILEKCDFEQSQCGYIGYSWFKSMFCGSDFVGINLRVFSALFPNLVKVRIDGLPCIDSKFMDHIYENIQNNMDTVNVDERKRNNDKRVTKIDYIHLGVNKQCTMEKVKEQEVEYYGTFASIFMPIFIRESREDQTPVLVISRFGMQMTQKLYGATVGKNPKRWTEKNPKLIKCLKENLNICKLGDKFGISISCIQQKIDTLKSILGDIPTTQILEYLEACDMDVEKCIHLHFTVGQYVTHVYKN